MSAASDTFELKMLMAQLETMIDNLVAILDSDESLRFVGYEAMPVKTENEEEALSDGQKFIEVKQLDTWENRLTVLNYFKRFYVADGYSTRFVSRMPGIIQTTLPATTIISLVTKINAKKDEIKALVRKSRNKWERHEFIHDVFPQIMTEQVYRHLRYSQEEIKSVWFRWKCKLQTNETFSNEEAIQWLSEQKKKPKRRFQQDEWSASVESIINDVACGHYSHLQRQREYRTFPDCHYSFYEYNPVTNAKEYKKNRYSATTPWILLNQPRQNLPGGTPLRSFELEKMNVEPKKKDELLFPPLKLIGVPK